MENGFGSASRAQVTLFDEPSLGLDASHRYKWNTTTKAVYIKVLDYCLDFRCVFLSFLLDNIFIAFIFAVIQGILMKIDPFL